MNLLVIFLSLFAATPDQVAIYEARAALAQVELQKELVEVAEATFILAQKQRQAGNVSDLFVAPKSVDLEETRIRLQEKEIGALAAKNLHVAAGLDKLPPQEKSNASDRLKMQREIVENYENIILPLRERILTLAQDRYRLMNYSIYDLLNDKRSFIEAKSAYQNALLEYWKAAP